MISPEEMAAFAKQQKEAEAAQAKMMKEMGLDMDDMGQGDDEMAALERELAGGMDEMDDEALLEQMAAKEARESKIAELESRVENEKQSAKTLMQAGDKQSALEHMRAMKAAQAELDQLLNPPPAAKPAAMPQGMDEAGGLDPTDLEDKYHDVDQMCSMGVIEYETGYLQTMMAKIADPTERDYYQNKIEALEFQSSSIQTNVETGMLTMDGYVLNCKKYKVKVEAMLKDAIQNLGPRNEHVTRLKKRIELLQAEISESEQMPEEQPDEEMKEEPAQVQKEVEQQPVAVNRQPEGGQAMMQQQPRTESLPQQPILQERTVSQEVSIENIEKNKQIVKIINERMDRLIQVAEFIKKTTGDRNQFEFIFAKVQKIKSIKQNVEVGAKFTEEDKEEISFNIDCQLLFGMSPNDKFGLMKERMEWVAKQRIEKMNQQNELKSKITKLKKQDQPQAIQLYKNLDAEVKSITALFHKMKDIAKNPLQPVPQIIDKETRVQEEKINEELKPNQIRVTLKGSAKLGVTDAHYVKYSIRYQEDDKNAFWENHFPTDGAEQTFMHECTNAQYAGFVKWIKESQVELTLKKKKLFGYKENKDDTTMSLRGLSSSNEVEKEVKLMGAPVTVKVEMRTATKAKEMIWSIKTKQEMGPIHEAFALKVERRATETSRATDTSVQSGQSVQQQPVQQQVNQPRPVQQPQKPQQQQQAQPQRPQPAQPQATAQNVPIPEGVDEADIKDPQNMNNNNCMTYLETMIPKFKAEIDAKMAQGVRADKRTKDLWLQCQQRKTLIETAIGGGQMTEEMYMKYQTDQIEKDKKMLKYFQQTGNAKKAAMVDERLKLIQSEMGGE